MKLKSKYQKARADADMDKMTEKEQDNKDFEDIADLSYEEAMRELEKIVAALERGEVKLVEAAALYERGVILARRCSFLLQSIEEQITKLTISDEGETIEEDLKELDD